MGGRHQTKGNAGFQSISRFTRRSAFHWSAKWKWSRLPRQLAALLWFMSIYPAETLPQHVYPLAGNWPPREEDGIQWKARKRTSTFRGTRAGYVLSSGEDEVSRVLLKASVRWHCRIRLKFGHELIPAFCGWVRLARRRTLVQLPKDGPDVDLLGAGAYNSCTTVPGRRYRSRWVQPPFSIFKTRDDGSFHWSRVRKTSNPPGARRKTCEVVAW